MFDIEKELKSINMPAERPDDTLREKTRGLVQREIRRMEAPSMPKRRVRSRVRWITGFAAAAVAALAVLLVLIPAQPAQAAGYYTVDINPSVSLRVNNDDIVISASAGNSDAAALLNGLELDGLSFADALSAIVSAAAEAGYLEKNGHVLVAHFGDTPGLTEEQAAAIVSNAAGEDVQVMLLQSTKTDFENAEKLHKNAGIELLKKDARSLGIDENMDLDDMISAVRGRNNKTGSDGPQGSASSGAANSSSGNENAGQQKEESSNGNPDNGNAQDQPDQNNKPDKTAKPDKTDKPDKTAALATCQPSETKAPEEPGNAGSQITDNGSQDDPWNDNSDNGNNSSSNDNKNDQDHGKPES